MKKELFKHKHFHFYLKKGSIKEFRKILIVFFKQITMIVMLFLTFAGNNGMVRNKIHSLGKTLVTKIATQIN